MIIQELEALDGTEFDVEIWNKVIKQLQSTTWCVFYIAPIHNLYIDRGVQAFQFRKHDFDLWVGDDGLDMYQQL